MPTVRVIRPPYDWQKAANRPPERITVVEHDEAEGATLAGEARAWEPGPVRVTLRAVPMHEVSGGEHRLHGPVPGRRGGPPPVRPAAVR